VRVTDEPLMDRRRRHIGLELAGCSRGAP